MHWAGVALGFSAGWLFNQRDLHAVSGFVSDDGRIPAFITAK
jgi:hypothetical protein